jgi:hypothetical protein
LEHILRVEKQARVADDAVAHGKRIVQHSRRAAVAANNLEALVGGGVDEIRGALLGGEPPIPPRERDASVPKGVGVYKGA